MKKAIRYFLCMLVILPMALLFSACGEHSLSVRLKVSGGVYEIIEDVNLVRMTASPIGNSDDDNIEYFNSDDRYKGDTTEVTVEFKDGYKLENAQITVNGQDYTDFEVQAKSDNEFKTFINFSLSCKGNTDYELTLDGDVVKIEKSYTIDLNVPVGEQSKPITKDFAGAEYLKEIEIKAFKGNETSAKYYTLEEIAQLNVEDEKKVEYKAYMEISKPVNDYVPIFYVKSASQYVNASLSSINSVDENSVISNMFKVGNNFLRLASDYYSYNEFADTEIANGNIHLSVERDTLISGETTLAIDPSVLLENFNKTYRVNVITQSSEFEVIHFTTLSANSTHEYGSEETITIIPSSVDSGIDTKNIDLTDAKITVNGIEVDKNDIIFQDVSNRDQISFKFEKTDTAEKFRGTKTTLKSDDFNEIDEHVFNIQITNVKLTDMDASQNMFVIEIPYALNGDSENYSFASGINQYLVGKVRDGNKIKLTFLMQSGQMFGYENRISFYVQEFGYDKFKLRLTKPNGDTFTTDEITLDVADGDYQLKKDGDNSNCDNVIVSLNQQEINIYLGGIKEYNEEYIEGSGALNWNDFSDYKFELIEV